MAFPCKITNPFINLDLHDGLFVIFAPPFLVPGKAMHAGAGCLVTARAIGENKENNRKILADGLEVVSQGHCVEKIILPHLNLFPFLPVNINTLIPLLLLGAESKCVFASLTVKGPDGPIAVTPLYVVGFNQTCNDPCCLPTSTLLNWGTVDLGFTMADFQAGLMSMAFDALIELAFEFGPDILGKMIPKGLKKQQAIVFKKLKDYGSVQIKKMGKQLDLLGKKFGKKLRNGLDISSKAKKRVTSWVKDKSERLVSKNNKLLQAGAESSSTKIKKTVKNQSSKEWTDIKTKLAKDKYDVFLKKTENMHPSQRGSAFEEWLKTNHKDKVYGKGRNKFVNPDQPPPKKIITDGWINTEKKELWEYKHYKSETTLTGHSKDQLDRYKMLIEKDEVKKINYVFSQKPSDDLFDKLESENINVFYLDKNGNLLNY